jgi:hypothetical protein
MHQRGDLETGVWSTPVGHSFGLLSGFHVSLLGGRRQWSAASAPVALGRRRIAAEQLPDIGVGGRQATGCPDFNRRGCVAAPD